MMMARENEYKVVEEMMVKMGWLEDGLTEEQCDNVCENCPFGHGGDHCYACACWEERESLERDW